MSKSLGISFLKWIAGFAYITVAGLPAWLIGMPAERLYLSGKGPVLYAGTAQSVIEQKGQWTVGTKWVKDSVVIASSQTDSGSTFSWTLNPDGSATFDYAFAPIEDALTYCAVGFDLP